MVRGDETWVSDIVEGFVGGGEAGEMVKCRCEEGGGPVKR